VPSSGIVETGLLAQGQPNSGQGKRFQREVLGMRADAKVCITRARARVRRMQKQVDIRRLSTWREKRAISSAGSSPMRQSRRHDCPRDVSTFAAELHTALGHESHFASYTTKNQTDGAVLTSRRRFKMWHCDLSSRLARLLPASAEAWPSWCNR
jgi:hypothetical protein